MELGILGAMVPCDTPTQLLEIPPQFSLEKQVAMVQEKEEGGKQTSF